MLRHLLVFAISALLVACGGDSAKDVEVATAAPQDPSAAKNASPMPIPESSDVAASDDHEKSCIEDVLLGIQSSFDSRVADSEVLDRLYELDLGECPDAFSELFDDFISLVEEADAEDQGEAALEALTELVDLAAKLGVDAKALGD